MIQSVSRAGQILLALGDGRLGVTELARRLGMAKPTVHGLLRTLAAGGLVEQDPVTGKYQLGLAVVRLGGAVLADHPLRAPAARWVETLARRTGLPAQAGVLSGAHVVLLHQAGGPPPAGHLAAAPAIRWDDCALGRAIVAHLPADDPRRPADDPRRPADDPRRPADDPRRPADDPRWPAEPARRPVPGAPFGIAVGEPGSVLGPASLAAPVRAPTGQVAGALGITGPAHRLIPDGPAADLLATVRDCAAGLSGDLATPPTRA